MMRIIKNSILRLLLLLLILPLEGEVQVRDFSNEHLTPHFTRERTYDVQHQILKLTLDPQKGRVRGRAITQLAPLVDRLEKVTFDAVELEISSVSLPDGNTLPFTTTDHELIVNLDRPYQTNELITLSVDYSAEPRMGLYFIRPDKGYPNKPWQIWSQGEMHENRYWFPCYDYPNDLMTSEMILTVPLGNRVISNGELMKVNETPEKGTVTYHWKENVPHVSYLVSLVVGTFVEVRDEWDGIPILYNVDPKDRNKVERTFSKTPVMMQFFSEKIGVRYPYEKYSQVTITDFPYGGMENVSATTLTERTLHDARAHLDIQSEGLVAHELAHQWWGNLLTSKNWNHIWLNEGFATYFANLFREKDLGENEFLLEMEKARRAYLSESSTKYRRSIVTNHYEDPSEMFDGHSYQKGAWVLHMIRYLLGDDLFWKAIHHYAETRRGRSVETKDLEQAIEESTGKPLEWFFEEWVNRSGHPEYEVSWKWNEEGKSVFLEVKQIQKVDEKTPLFRMPIEIQISGTFGEKSFRVEIDDASETFYLPVPERPDRVEFDPHHWVLKELHFKKEKKELLNQLKDSNNLMSRMHALEELEEYPEDPKVLEALETTLRSDPFWGLRSQAATSLGKMRTRKAKEILLSSLKDLDSRVRREGIKALGHFKEDSEIAKILVTVLRSDSSYYAQAEAIRSLAKIQSSKAFSTCITALNLDSHNEEIRKAAFEGFVELKDPRGIQYALHWADYGNPVEVRTSALSALSQLAQYDEKKKETLREVLENYLEDPHFRIRIAAVNALGNLEEAKAIPALERFIHREPHFSRKKTAREAIRKIRESQEMETSLAKVKAELEELKEENRVLRKRVEGIEAKLGILGEAGTLEAKGTVEP